MQQTAFRKTQPALTARPELFSGVAGAVLRAPVAFFDSLSALQRQAEERAHLRQLTDHQLQDMGLTRSQAEEMARKPRWSRAI